MLEMRKKLLGSSEDVTNTGDTSDNQTINNDPSNDASNYITLNKNDDARLRKIHLKAIQL